MRIVLIAFAGHSLYAQTQLDFAKYNTTDGLPSNHIECVYADPDGFVWAGTRVGVARFDGQKFVPLVDLVPHQKITRGNVRVLTKDKQGRLWVPLPLEGVKCVDIARQKVYTFTHDFLKTDHIMHPVAHVDQAGNIWFVAVSGLACYKVATGAFEYFPAPKDAAGNLPQVYTFCVGVDGNFWVMAAEQLYYFDLQTGRWTHNRHFPGISDHAGLLPEVDGSLWITCWYRKKDGLMHYDPKSKQVLRSFTANPQNPDSIPSTDFQGYFAEKDRLWFATNDVGLVCYDKASGRFSTYQPDKQNDKSLSELQTQSVCRDLFGNLWVGTSRFLNAVSSKTQFIHLIGPKAGLIGSDATITASVGRHKMLIGTREGLSIYDTRKKTFLNVNLPLYNRNPYNNSIVSAAPCDENSCWVGTWQSVSRLDLNSGRLLEYYIIHSNAGNEHPPDRIFADIDVVYQMCRDKGGNLWLSAGNRVLKLRRSAEGRVSFEKMPPPQRAGNLSGNEASCFLPAGEGLLYIGTFDGIVRFDVSRGTMQLLPVTFPNAQLAWIQSIGMFGNGDLVVLMHGRLYRFDPDQPQSTLVEIPVPIPNYKPMDMTVDQYDNIWISGEGGLLRVDGKSNICTLYDPENFLDNNFFSFAKINISRDENGFLYFAGSEGVSIVNPHIVHKVAEPVVKIVSIRVNNEIIPLDAEIQHCQAIALNYDQNNLLLDFSVFNSDLPELNHFAYRIEGLSDNWVSLNRQRSLNLVNLAPGTYTLQVRGSNSDGATRELEHALRIVIRAPWWATWWAYAAYVLLLGAGLWRLNQIRMRRFRLEQKLAGERMERERLAALDAFKSRFFTNISHEFRTPLTVILGFTQRWLGGQRQWEESEVRHNMEMIHRNGENLLRLIAEILDLARLENNALKLNYVQNDVLAYLKYISESMHSLAAVHQVRLEVQSRQTTIVMDYDPERLLQIVHNLLSNAIKFTADGGQVLLSVGVEEQAGRRMLALQVSDTGAGIPEDQLGGIFDRFFQAENQQYTRSGGTGVGLSLTRELVRAMGGNISVESTVGVGSTFRVLLPLTNNAALTPVPELAGRVSVPEASLTVLPAASGNADLPLLLLVEDNPDVMAFLSDCLKEDYRLEYAVNGKQGVEKALEIVPDLVISDVMMPEMDGLEACHLLKNDERTSHIPVVLLTAKADVESRISGLRRGADVYLSKPFHEEELKVVLQNLQDQRQKWQAFFAARNLRETAPAEVAGLNAAAVQLEDVFLKKLLEQIEMHLGDQDFDGPNLARLMLLSEVQLYRKIKALTGKSTAVYIRSIRLGKARELLRSTNFNISEIAYQVGFEDPKYFSRAFSQEFGVSPSDFRK